MARKTKAKRAERPLRPEQIGKMGEAEFAKLCAAGGLVAPDSRGDDKMGWDFLVEFPHPHQRGDTPFDKRVKLPDMKLQVKTIWADGTSVAVDLSAADRLAGWDYPSFIAILRLNMDKTFKDLHLIHLLDDNLGMILKALRKAEAEGSLSIKKKTVTFSIGHGVSLQTNGDELAEALRSALGNSPDDYVIRKRDQRRTLGYGARPFSGAFTLSARDDDEMLDMLLGLKAVRTEDFRATETRFDIALPFIKEEGAEISFRPESVGKGQLVLASETGDRSRAIIDGDIYAAGLRKTSGKLRFHSPIATLQWQQGADQADLNVGSSPDTCFSMAEIVMKARAHHAMASGKLSAALRLSGKRLPSFSIRQSVDPARKKQAAGHLDYVLGLQSMFMEAGLSAPNFSEIDLRDSFGSLSFALKSRTTCDDFTVSVTIVPHADQPPLPDVVDGILAGIIRLPETTLAFWSTMTVHHVAGGAESSTLTCSNFLLRDMTRVEDDQGFDDFVKDASEETGIRLVLKTENMTWPDRVDEDDVGDDSAQ